MATSPLDFILETAETHPLAAGEMLTQSLMAGDPATLKLGYSLGSALIAATKMLNLDATQVALIADRIYRKKS